MDRDTCKHKLPPFVIELGQSRIVPCVVCGREIKITGQSDPKTEAQGLMSTYWLIHRGGYSRLHLYKVLALLERFANGRGISLYIDVSNDYDGLRGIYVSYPLGTTSKDLDTLRAAADVCMVLAEEEWPSTRS